MDFGFILTTSLSPAIGITAIIFCLGRHRAEHPVRLHRAAELRPGGLPRRGRLRPRATVSPSAQPLAGHPRRHARRRSCSRSLLGIPTLRLRADYLAIVTIAAAEILRLVPLGEASSDFLGGADGHQRVRRRASTSSTPSHRGIRLRPDLKFTDPPWWVDHRRLVPRGAVSACSPSRSCAAPGAASSRASARTRMRCAAWARTSTCSRCRS